MDALDVSMDDVSIWRINDVSRSAAGDGARGSIRTRSSQDGEMAKTNYEAASSPSASEIITKSPRGDVRTKDDDGDAYGGHASSAFRSSTSKGPIRGTTS